MYQVIINAYISHQSLQLFNFFSAQNWVFSYFFVNAGYGEYEAIIDINELEVKSGYIPPRVLGVVIKWAALNQQ